MEDASRALMQQTAKNVPHLKRGTIVSQPLAPEDGRLTIAFPRWLGRKVPSPARQFNGLADFPTSRRGDRR